jgi:polyhydroxyalkanoate synthesis regulator phasin
MGIFGRKKEKDHGDVAFPPRPIPRPAPGPKEQKEIPVHIMPPMPHQSLANAAPPQTTPISPPKEDTIKPQAAAPLFVKLTRYRQIITTMNQIKYSINLIRNQIVIMNELEGLRAENMRILQSAIENVNKRLAKLDSDFMRPTGFMDNMPEMQMEEMDTLEGTITDLRDEISGLKEEVETYG